MKREDKKFETFQSTLPYRERPTLIVKNITNNNVSIHAPVQGATNLLWKKKTVKQFQSTLPYRERLLFLINPAPLIVFQSTLPYRERPYLYRQEVVDESFNPRSRTGSDYFLFQHYHYHIVSIHAPVQGATVEHGLDKSDFNVSIHAPVQGATKTAIICYNRVECFNPRSRKGSD